MQVVTVIAARAGSRGCPGKNRAMICGKPAVCYTIEYALAAKMPDFITGRAVCVTSDDKAILRLKSAYPDVVFIERAPELATDTARIDDVAFDAVKQIGYLTGSNLVGELLPHDPVIILYGNVPVRPAGLIERALEKYGSCSCDSIRTVRRCGAKHPAWAVALEADRVHEPPEWQDKYRRQDLPVRYFIDGALTLVKYGVLASDGDGKPGPFDFLGRDRRGIVVTEPTIDIDEPADLDMARAWVATERIRRIAKKQIAAQEKTDRKEKTKNG